MKKILLLTTMFVASNSQASDVSTDNSGNNASIGVASAISTGPYRDYKRKVDFLPVISYEGSFLYIRGIDAGLKIYNSESDEISISTSVLPFFYKPKDAKNESMKNLNERKLSLMAGLSWMHKATWGFTSLSAKQRVSGNKEGAIMAASYGYPFQFGKTSLIVSTGIEYSNAEMNQNYFGITADEAKRSGFSRYSPKGDVSPYVDFLMIYPLTDSLDVSAGARLTRLSDEIYNSPMVKERLMQSFVASVSYRF